MPISTNPVVTPNFTPGGAGGVSVVSLSSDLGGRVPLKPEFDYIEQFKKDETRHRSLTGAEFAYNWGFFKRWKFSILFLNSEQATQINSWWITNTDVKLRFFGETPSDVRIVNRTTPISKRMEGRHDLFRGVIELETYT